jgi:hypothetical protein
VSLDLGTLREGIEPPSVPVTHEPTAMPVGSEA